MNGDPAVGSPTAPMEVGSESLARLIATIAEGALDRERTRERPFDMIELVRRARLGALRVPREDGGGGASLRELFAVVIALAAADVNVAHILRGHFAFVEERLRLQGPERSRVIALATSGLLVGNAHTELGTTTIGVFTWQTKLTPEGDGYRLDGTKYFTTGTLYSDYAEVLASLPNGATALVLVPTDRDGVTLLDDWDGMGQRMTGTGTTRFEHVRIEADEVIALPLPEPGEDIEPLYLSGAFFQLYVTALIAGILHTVRDDAIAHIHQRKRTFAWAPADTPAGDPLLQQVVGELASAAFAAEATVLSAADALAIAFDAALIGADSDLALAHEASLQASYAKVVVDELGQRAASRLFDVGGASIVQEAHLLDRHWRNIRTLASHNPTLYKAQSTGAYLLNGTLLPGSGYF
jgi:alkylation response protein AidB-like acyl-CoA dehydrogenase